MFRDSAEFYDAIYSFKDYAAEAAQIAGRVHSVHPGARTLLDVGCGTGEHARALSANHGFDVDGLDLDPALLAIARSKHPRGRFFETDMADFSLGHTYDVIVCLFSSIGYLVTLERTRCALVCFLAHLSPEGVLLVEPWFPPGVLDDSRVFRHTGTHRGWHVERLSRTEIDGRVSRLHFEYLIETPDGPRHVTEVHELGLITEEEMGTAFQEAGFSAEFDKTGLTGRGVWVAKAAI